MTRLSVNLNKVCVLRESRGGDRPSLLKFAALAVTAGAQGITLHPRPDRRHANVDDVQAIAAWLPRGVEFNIEGNPFAPARAGYPGFAGLLDVGRPCQATLVPDDDGQRTSDHGFDPVADAASLAGIIAALPGCSRISVFVDAGARDFGGLRAAGVERIEIYTGPYAAAARGQSNVDRELSRAAATARAARAAGLGVNAGHDLDQTNLQALLRAVQPDEVSIGHALIADALSEGFERVVAAYAEICRRSA